MSNEKEAPGCLGYIGDEILPRIRIPINQPRFNGKSSVCFFRSSGVIHTVDGNQKSQQRPEVYKARKSCDKLITSTGFLAGFLVAINSSKVF